MIKIQSAGKYSESEAIFNAETQRETRRNSKKLRVSLRLSALKTNFSLSFFYQRE